MMVAGFHVQHPAHLSADDMRAVCDSLEILHHPAGRRLWLTNRCDGGQLHRALRPDCAGLIEAAAPLPESFRRLWRDCPEDGFFLLMSTRSAHECDLAAPLSAAWKERYQPQDDPAMDLELALQEALANAILHGNLGLDSSWRATADLRSFAQMQRERLEDRRFSQRRVAVLSCRQGDCLSVTVLNEGDGFDWQAAVDPQRLGADYARGLSLIHRLSRETLFQDQGRMITMLLPLA